MHICTFCEVIGGSSLRMTYEKCSLNIFEMTHNANELMKSIVNLKLLIYIYIYIYAILCEDRIKTIF
jgi:hypothetical protein